MIKRIMSDKIAVDRQCKTESRLLESPRVSPIQSGDKLCKFRPLLQDSVWNRFGL